MAYQETCPVSRKPYTTAFTRAPTVGWGGGETKFSKTKHCYHDKFNSKALLVAKFRCLPDPWCCLASPKWTILVPVLFTLFFCNLVSFSSLRFSLQVYCAVPPLFFLYHMFNSLLTACPHVRLRIGTIQSVEHDSRIYSYLQNLKVLYNISVYQTTEYYGKTKQQILLDEART